MSWLFLFFCISGFCGILYEIIWLRLAMASFGVTSALVSIVLSVFMAGLGLGLVEWGPYRTAEGQFSAALQGEFPLDRFVAESPETPTMQDDRPVNEYFLLRLLSRKSPTHSGQRPLRLSRLGSPRESDWRSA